MTGYIFYSKIDYNRNSWFANELIKNFKTQQIDITLFIIDDCQFVVEDKIYIVFKEKKYNKADFAIIRSINNSLNYFLETMKIPCFNSFKTSYLCNNKFLTYTFVNSLGIKGIPSLFANSDNILAMAKGAFSHFNCKELIIKTVDGHGGKEVFLTTMENLKNDIMEILKTTTKENISRSYCLQPRICGTAKDMRVYVLDNKVYGVMLRTSTSSFKSNFTLGGECQEVTLTASQELVVNKIINNLKADFYGIDFLIDDNNNFIFNEIEDIVGTRMLYSTGNYDPVKDYVSYIIKKYINLFYYLL